MANEPYRLRSLAFEWEKRAGAACEDYRDYKGYCIRCEHGEAEHTLKVCVRELRALLAEPAILEEAAK
jgi:hypothetical protein